MADPGLEKKKTRWRKEERRGFFKGCHCCCSSTGHFLDGKAASVRTSLFPILRGWQLATRSIPHPTKIGREEGAGGDFTSTSTCGKKQQCPTCQKSSPSFNRKRWKHEHSSCGQQKRFFFPRGRACSTGLHRNGIFFFRLAVFGRSAFSPTPLGPTMATLVSVSTLNRRSCWWRQGQSMFVRAWDAESSWQGIQRRKSSGILATFDPRNNVLFSCC